MNYDYNLEEIKESLTIEQIMDIVAEMGGEPRLNGEVLLCKTICHNGDSHKLYYYDNTHLFRCYTGCADPTFDIFELVRKVKSREYGEDYQLPQAVEYVATYFGFVKNFYDATEETPISQYLTNLEKYDRIKNIDIKNQIVELKFYDDKILNNLPKVRIPHWEKEGITPQALEYYEICYEPKQQCIVIPHRDIDGNLIGIRQRTLIEEQALFYGKYMPLKLGNVMYTHPLSFNLYGLYQNKENIKRIKKAIVLESEKSVMQLDTILGRENNIGVACCGQTLTNYQMELLYNLGAKEIIIAWDREGQQDNKQQYIKKFYALQKKFGKLCTISFMYDKTGEYLDYKMSPTDKGKDVFLLLYKERIPLY